MLNKAYLLSTDTCDPYLNLALEEHLLKVLPQDAILLYLWQNAHTVVIGKNQNAYREVNLSAFERDGGHLARRLSGGGAVYHDLGNLNFTFIMPEADFNTEKQMAVLVEAVRAFGLQAMVSGRNDALVDGRKFSGNAYYHSGRNAYHHGTVLVDTDGAKIAKYLNVSKKKLESKGVQSVHSRVCNLCELNADITCDKMRGTLGKAFGKVYALPVRPFPKELIDWDEVEKIRKRINQSAYFRGRQADFTFVREERFSWGEVQVHLRIEKGFVEQALIYSDAMEEAAISEMQGRLNGIQATHEAFAQALNGPMGRDILSLLEDEANGL
jgi:lipoyltransferase and lipoate-protein ligase